MVTELKKFIDNKKVFFGAKQALKNSKELNNVIVPMDCRADVKNILQLNKINFRVIDLKKEELRIKLGIDFQCEVFCLRK